MNYYFIIGIVVALLYLLFCIVNIFFDITRLDGFTYGLCDYNETLSEDAFVLSLISFLVSILIVIAYPFFVFAAIVWLLFKLKKKSIK